MSSSRKTTTNLLSAIGYRLILGALISIAGFGASVANAQLIDGRFQIMDDGQTVKDVKTNLIWTRCSFRQENSNGTCSGGQAVPLRWNSALETVQELNAASGYAGAKNWRLPTIAEWAALRDCSKVSASSNTKTVTVFGQTKTIEEVVDVPKFTLLANKNIIFQKCPMATTEEVFPNNPRGENSYFFSSTNTTQVNKGTAQLFSYEDPINTALVINFNGFIGAHDKVRGAAYIRYVRTGSK